MKGRVNSYIAILFITALGAGAAMIIIHVANTDTFAVAFSSDANYY